MHIIYTRRVIIALLIAYVAAAADLEVIAKRSVNFCLLSNTHLINFKCHIDCLFVCLDQRS